MGTNPFLKIIIYISLFPSLLLKSIYDLEEVSHIDLVNERDIVSIFWGNHKVAILEETTKAWGKLTIAISYKTKHNGFWRIGSGWYLGHLVGPLDMVTCMFFYWVLIFVRLWMRGGNYVNACRWILYQMVKVINVH